MFSLVWTEKSRFYNKQSFAVDNFYSKSHLGKIFNEQLTVSSEIFIVDLTAESWRKVVTILTCTSPSFGIAEFCEQRHKLYIRQQKEAFL